VNGLIWFLERGKDMPGVKKKGGKKGGKEKKKRIN